MQEIIANIRAAHRERCFAMEQRKRADLSLLSFLRTQAGWRLDLPEKDRKAIAERAKAFADGGEDEGLAQWRSVVDASVGARAPFEAVEKAALKRMGEAAEQLPVWESFGEAIRGFGPASLAVIVGEAGDLSIYSNPAKLWKRMGVGIVGDIRQGGLAKNASKDDWIAHGYSRQKHRGAGHMHNRARRYVEKRLLRDLWSAWRQTTRDVKPNQDMSAASLSDQQARVEVSPTLVSPAAATGHGTSDAQTSSAGRSHSNSEAMELVLPKPVLPRKRRAKPLAQTIVATPGASIQQATIAAQPKRRPPADAPDLSSHEPQSRAVRRSTLSRANGTCGQSTTATQSPRAAR